VFIIAIIIVMVGTIVYANNKTHYTELKIFNPYSSVSVELLVKCDHNWKSGKYNYYKKIVVNRNSNVAIKTPNNLKKCEIWPINMKLFGDLARRNNVKR
jgi:hypothetical protein